jgi:hypothetical protein
MSDEQIQDRTFIKPSRAHSTKASLYKKFVKEQEHILLINEEDKEDNDEAQPSCVADSSSDDIQNNLKMKNSKLTNLDVKLSRKKNKNYRHKRGRSFDNCFTQRISISAILNVEEALNRLEEEVTTKRKLNRSHTMKLKKVTIRNSITAIYWDTPKPAQTPNLSAKSILKVSSQKNSCTNFWDKLMSFIKLLLRLIDFKEILKVFGVSVGSFIISYLFFKKLKL